MVRIGIIGTGKHGSRYANHIVNDLPSAELSGISRRSAEGRVQAGEWDCTYFENWSDLVADPAVDAVVAVVPPGLNLEIARKCADCSKPLLMEKPLARDFSEAVELVRVMEAAGCPLTVGQTLRYNPVIAALKGNLSGMGPLYSFSANQRLEPSPLAWHDDPVSAGAGVVMHTAVHVFDALKVITGQEVKRVMAHSRCVHSRNLEDMMVMLVECEDGLCGTIDVSKVGDARSGRFEFVCRDGQLIGEQIYGFVEIIEQNVVKERSEYEPIPTILPLLKDWVDFLTGQKHNPVSGDDGSYAVRVCSAALQSAQEGRWIDV